MGSNTDIRNVRRRAGRRLPLFACLLLAASCAFAQQSAPLDPAQPFASAGDAVIQVYEYRNALVRAIRSRFYHGRIPRGDVEPLLARVAQELIDERLLAAEALRRDLAIETALVEQQLAQVDDANQDKPGWEERREALLANLRTELVRETRINALEAEVRAVGAPTEQALRAFYAANPDKFTEPERNRISLLLVAVEPWQGSEAWAAAKAEIEQLAQRLRDGEPFAEVARAHSDDPTAAAGGDMGYVHQGMLGGQVTEAVATLAVGEMTPPQHLLEGYAILELTERRPARLRDFADVRERAADLWRKATADAAWEGLLAELRQGSGFVIDESVMARFRDELNAMSQ